MRCVKVESVCWERKRLRETRRDGPGKLLMKSLPVFFYPGMAPFPVGDRDIMLWKIMRQLG